MSKNEKRDYVTIGTLHATELAEALDNALDLYAALIGRAGALVDVRDQPAHQLLRKRSATLRAALAAATE